MGFLVESFRHVPVAPIEMDVGPLSNSKYHALSINIAEAPIKPHVPSLHPN